MDPELYAQLMRNVDYSFVVFYRWLLLDFKRGFVMNVPIKNLFRIALLRSVEIVGSGLGGGCDVLPALCALLWPGPVDPVQGDFDRERDGLHGCDQVNGINKWENNNQKLQVFQ